MEGETRSAEDLDIAPMTADDIETVLGIERRTFSNPWSRRAFEEALCPDGYAMVARNSGEIVGYAVAWLSPNEMHIVNLAVREDLRRRRIGSILLGHLLKAGHEKSLDRATLEVRMSNGAAIAMYESHGFRKIAVDRGYYLSPPEDAVIMLKDLHSEE
jgi:ribosomal-protein-alanine N-acetyltransferase